MVRMTKIYKLLEKKYINFGLYNSILVGGWVNDYIVFNKLLKYSGTDKIYRLYRNLFHQW